MNKSKVITLTFIFLFIFVISALAFGLINKRTINTESTIINRVPINSISKASIEDFIRNNSVGLDINDDEFISKLYIFDEDIENTDVFLAGEGHGIKGNFQLQLALLKFFNQKAEVRYLLSEIGYSTSAYINEYIITGNEDILKVLYKNLKGTSSWSKESYEFWKKLRDYNMTLPEDKKIKVIGIDIEHQITTAIDYLYSIIPSSNAPDKILKTIESFKSNKEKMLNEDEFKKSIILLQKDVYAYENSYKEYFENDFFNFSMVLDNIINSINFYESNSDELREKSIYSNFKRVYSHFPIEKYFGQWGMEHVYQRICCSYMGKNPRFAMYLNNDDSPVKNKVISIAYGYKNSYRMTWGKEYGEAKADSNINDIHLIDNLTDENVAILKLNGNNSPFDKDIYFVENPIGGATTDYFKYIVLINNSKGTTPLEE